MSGVNKVILIGNLGADPELRYTPNGSAVAEIRLATNETWVDKNGQKQERVEWHRVVVWGKRGEVAAKYLKKGRQCYIEGRIQTRSWDDKDGNKRYMTEVIAEDVVFLGGGGGSGERGQRDEPAPRDDGGFPDQGGGFGGGFGGQGGDIPF